MADGDDYERLLREVEQFTSGGKSPAQPGSTPTPATVPQRGDAAKASAGRDAAAVPAGSSGARVAWSVVAAVGGLVIGGVLGLFLALLPFIGPIETALGASLGAALAAFVSGPPGWFDRE